MVVVQELESRASKVCASHHGRVTNTSFSAAGQALYGASAVAKSKRCLTTGIALGGDSKARAQSPAEVAAFLKAAFK